MPWEYNQTTGEMKHNGQSVGRGYSGAGRRGSVSRNNPKMEAISNTGPIPQGRYLIGSPRKSAKTGPHVMDLTPIGHSAHGRSAFQIHGNNKTDDASSGCIIMPPAVRKRISSSGDNELVVISGAGAHVIPGLRPMIESLERVPRFFA